MWLTPALPPKEGKSDPGHDLYAMVTSFTTSKHKVGRTIHFSRIGRPTLSGVKIQSYGSSLSGSPEKFLTDLSPHRGVGVDDRFRDPLGLPRLDFRESIREEVLVAGQPRNER